MIPFASGDCSGNFLWPSRQSIFAVKVLVVVAIAVGTITGCVYDQKKSQVSTASARPVETEIAYFDAGSFDRKLSVALASDAPSVTLTFPAPINASKIPERLDKWFATVEKGQGNVELIEEPKAGQRGLASLVLSLAVGAYDLYKEAQLYAPAQNYNARVYYVKGSGKVTRVIFRHK
jgi:hypothetical protein